METTEKVDYPADGLKTENEEGGPAVLLTETIKQWIRTFLLTANLPMDTREELRSYTSRGQMNHRRRKLDSDSEVKEESDAADKKTSARTIPFRLIKSVYDMSNDKSRGIYLHELLEGSNLHLPELELPERNPELEARVQRLKAEQASQEYDRWTRNVQNPQRRMNSDKDESIGKQLQQMNRQLLTVFNFVLTVAGSFSFAYKAVEYAMETPSFPVQLLGGVVVATIVFIADLYFLIKRDM